MEALLQGIPESAYGPILGALVGAAIALAAVALQLAVNARQRRLDREHQLRRDVYLQAAEGIAVGTELLAGFGNLDVAIQDLAASARGKQGWANKLHIVASL